MGKDNDPLDPEMATVIAGMTTAAMMAIMETEIKTVVSTMATEMAMAMIEIILVFPTRMVLKVASLWVQWDHPWIT